VASPGEPTHARRFCRSRGAGHRHERPRGVRIAGDVERWPLAGDQLYVEFDISEENLPPGSRVAIGEAVLEVSAKPHTGCEKFSARFGLEALRLVSTPEGRALRLRGMNTRVAVGGAVRVGDRVELLQTQARPDR
jgi:hypothetical protein